MSNRLETIVTLLACSREDLACHPSLHRTHACGRDRVALDRLWQTLSLLSTPWGADRLEVLSTAYWPNCPSLKVVYFSRQLSNAAPNVTPHATTRTRSSLSRRVHLGPTRAPSASCIRQHSARQRSRPCPRLGTRPRYGSADPFATFPPSSHRFAVPHSGCWQVAGSSPTIHRLARRTDSIRIPRSRCDLHHGRPHSRP